MLQRLKRPIVRKKPSTHVEQGSLKLGTAARIARHARQDPPRRNVRQRRILAASIRRTRRAYGSVAARIIH